MKKMLIQKAAVLVCVTTSVMLAGCGSSAEDNQKSEKEASVADSIDASTQINETTSIDLSNLSEEVLVEKAKKEGNKFVTVGMPDDWANWKSSWDAINKKYGIEHEDTDMTSAEELQTFDAEKDDATRDLGDIGMSMTPTAMEMGVVQPYKAATWDSIPDWAKDPDGNWTISYTGTMTFCAISDTVNGKLPTTWEELMDSNYKVSVGNVPSGAASQAAVISAAYAMGGDMNNLQPGIDYFIKLAKEGRLDPGDTTYARMADGEMEVCAAQYEYGSLNWRDNLKKDSGQELLVTIPQDGALTTGYALVFNKYSKHPYTTALVINYLLSDEGQIDRARGYAHPIREVDIPSDINGLDKELYNASITVDDISEFNDACSTVAKLWTEQVVPLIN
ncbi:MAG: ABC transporter substrate-binding protein [Lachnospiraceae bacterium]|nr:ABC transporter substrate-binding protein [Lachnospiraceae bacterium]